MDIPMRVKQPIHTSELEDLNRTSARGSLQTLRGDLARGRPAPAPRPAPPPRPTPAPRPEAQKPAHPPAAGTILQKGQKISLTQLAPGLSGVEVGMGWELGPGGRGYDLDVEAFLLTPAGSVPGDEWFVFYNQPVSPDGAVRLLEPPASGPRDDRVLGVELDRLDPRVSRIVFIVTIDGALDHGYHFGNIANAYIRVVDRSARRELVRFPLTEYYSSVCSMVVGELYRYKDEWRFSPVGNGTGEDLAGLCTRYGVRV